MTDKSLINKLGRSIINNISHKFHKQKMKQLKTALPLIYAGTWLFIDDLSRKKHKLEITVDLRILIDKHELPGKVEQLDEHNLIFLDNYGYHLKVTAQDYHPVTVFDEADNRSYNLSEYYKNEKI